jgi:hypothetical protein
MRSSTATPETDAPGRNVSSAIRRFSSRDQEPRERLTAPASITARIRTADELNDADPAASNDNVHQPIVDTSPISSGTTNLAASLIVSVGGQWLTLTGTRHRTLVGIPEALLMLIYIGDLRTSMVVALKLEAGRVERSEQCE